LKCERPVALPYQFARAGIHSVGNASNPPNTRGHPPPLEMGPVKEFGWSATPEGHLGAPLSRSRQTNSYSEGHRIDVISRADYVMRQSRHSTRYFHRTVPVSGSNAYRCPILPSVARRSAFGDQGVAVKFCLSPSLRMSYDQRLGRFLIQGSNQPVAGTNDQHLAHDRGSGRRLTRSIKRQSNWRVGECREQLIAVQKLVLRRLVVFGRTSVVSHEAS